jgi:hypothetical protein
VPLGADDREATEVDHLVVLGAHLLLDRVQGVGPGGLVLLGVLQRVEPRSRSALSARNSVLPPSMMSVPRPAMLVATVTAPL